jgi:mRNA interferase YafQ
MLTPSYNNQFKKDLKLAKKRNKNREHKLSGNLKNFWECHIEPDWLLIYKITSLEAVFIRTGSHSDLFE